MYKTIQRWTNGGIKENFALQRRMWICRILLKVLTQFVDQTYDLHYISLTLSIGTISENLQLLDVLEEEDVVWKLFVYITTLNNFLLIHDLNQGIYAKYFKAHAASFVFNLNKMHGFLKLLKISFFHKRFIGPWF